MPRRTTVVLHLEYFVHDDEGGDSDMPLTPPEVADVVSRGMVWQQRVQIDGKTVELTYSDTREQE